MIVIETDSLLLVQVNDRFFLYTAPQPKAAPRTFLRPSPEDEAIYGYVFQSLFSFLLPHPSVSLTEIQKNGVFNNR